MPSVRHLRSLGGARPPYLRRVARLGHLALGHSGQSPGPAQPGACSCNSASIVIIVCVICSRITSRAVPALSPPLGWADDTDYRTSGPSRASGGSGGDGSRLRISRSCEKTGAGQSRYRRAASNSRGYYAWRDIRSQRALCKRGGPDTAGGPRRFRDRRGCLVLGGLRFR